MFLKLVFVICILLATLLETSARTNNKARLNGNANGAMKNPRNEEISVTTHYYMPDAENKNTKKRAAKTKYEYTSPAFEDEDTTPEFDSESKITTSLIKKDNK
eukprot:GHVL01000790.1.p1 GENE.GHVL01000790.1~~GHVL01000790.1.p1  ORF type:complete len:103 (+),score=10.11 GHVL01000790.1:73-381(+)